MRINKDFRVQNILVGREASGKTFWAERLGNIYAQKGGGVLVYNRGMPSDFSDYEEITFPTFSEVERSLPTKKARQFKRFPFVPWFEYRGQRVPMHLFHKFSRGRKLYSLRIPDRRSESAFFRAMHFYAANTLFIFDDTRPVFRYGLDENHVQFFNAKRHSGKKLTEAARGVDVLMLFHGLDKVSPELYDYTSHITMFAVNRMPEPNHIDNSDLYDLVRKAKAEIDKAPKYHYAQINLRGKDPYTYKVFKPVKP